MRRSGFLLSAMFSCADYMRGRYGVEIVTFGLGPEALQPLFGEFECVRRYLSLSRFGGGWCWLLEVLGSAHGVVRSPDLEGLIGGAH